MSIVIYATIGFRTFCFPEIIAYEWGERKHLKELLNVRLYDIFSPWDFALELKQILCTIWLCFPNLLQINLLVERLYFLTKSQRNL